ncbi:alpha-galactosidase, partial [Verrucomicrobiota bacterium]
IDFEKSGGLHIGDELNKAHILRQRRLGGDVCAEWIWEKLYDQTQFLADTMCCVCDSDTSRAVTLGFVTTGRMFGQCALDFDQSFMTPKKLGVYCDAEDIKLSSGENVDSELLWLDVDDSASTGVEKYARRVAVEMKAMHHFKAPTGWSTWDYWFGDINEENILANVKFLREHHDEIPVEYIQIDAGYCNELRDWTKWNEEKFPNGPKWLVSRIKEHGFKAGLWLIPFYVHKKSRIYESHAEWLVKDRNGAPVQSLEGSLVLDGTHPEAQNWLRELARTITQEWGFEYIKIDGASMIGITKGVHYDVNAGACQAYRRGIEAFRSGMAERTFFMGGVFGPSIGIVDAMRVGGDVGARWDGSKTDIHHGARDRYHGSGNIKRSIFSTLNSWYMNNEFWINDADYLVVRDDRSELTLAEARTWASVLGLYGGSVILGDNMPSMKKERLEIISKIFPLYAGAARPVDFMKEAIPGVLLRHVKTHFEEWKIVCLLNHGEQTAERKVDFREIGLDSHEKCHVHAFWQQKYHGLTSEEIAVILEPHACEILAIRKERDIPQVVGTDMHITQGALELENAQWNSNGILDLSLNAMGSRDGRVLIHIPKEWQLAKVLPADLRYSTQETNLLRLCTGHNGHTSISLNFSRTGEA